MVCLFLSNSSPLFAQLKADFNANITSGCSPISVSFTDLSTGNPTSWSWDFGNGQSSVAKNPKATYISPGKYTVTLTIQNSTSTSTVKKTDFIIVYKNPIADFTISKTLACANENIAFTCASIKGDSDIDKWYWDFGDGSYSNLSNPLHAYTNSGKYSITLILTDKNNCTHSIQKKDIIDVKAVKADFIAAQTFYCEKPANVSFTNQSSSNAFSYQWDFGDGNISVDKNPQNTYQNTGKYTVKLRVDDQYGCTDVIEKKDYISVLPIIPDFEMIKIDSCQPARVEFINKSSPETGLSYYWVFGNSSTSTLKNPSIITYNNSGDFVVKLTVSMQSCNITASKTLKIYQKPQISFTGDTTIHCVSPFTVNYTVIGSDQHSYNWDFGDEKSSNIKNAKHQYLNYGYYTVVLTAKSTEGCENKVVREEYIKAKPSEIVVIIDTIEGCRPLKVRYHFSDTNLVALNKYEAYSGHGQYSTKAKDSFVYDTTGKFMLHFKASNNRGCKAEYFQEIAVGSSPKADFSDFFYEGCNDTFLHFTNLTNTHQPKANRFKWFFGDGDSSETEHPDHKYQDTGYLNVKLIAFYNGCPDTFIRDSMVKIRTPIAKLDNIFICYPKALEIINKSIGGNLWEWYLDDKFFSSEKEPKLNLNPGTYRIKLRVEDKTTGCIDRDSMMVNVIAPPQTKILYQIMEPCIPALVKLSDTSTRQLLYFWKLGSDTSSFKSPLFTLNNGGSYPVYLRIEDEHGCINEYNESDQIKISQFNMEYAISDYAGCLPLKIDVSDNSVSNFKIIERKWDFGTGNVFISYGRDTSFTYKILPYNYKQNTGFTLKLMLTDQNGCVGYISKKVYPTKPKPFIVVKQNDNCKETKLELSTFVNDTTVHFPAKVAWYINNQLAGTNYTFKQTFSVDTTLNIRLRITDAFECAENAYQQINISHAPPKADFSYHISSSVNDCPPMVVHFYNKSIKGKNDIVKYRWDFGNNSYSNVNSPVNSYSYPGTFSVSLIAEDSEGCLDTIMKPDIIKVNGATGTYDFFPKKGCGSVESIFSINSNNAKEFIWDFGDGNSSEDSTPVHTYDYGGIFKPILILKDSLGCLTSLTSDDSIIVFNNPHAQFSIKDMMTCLGKEVHFINNTWHEQDILKWEWDLGDGFKTTAFEPKYQYNDTGRYSVSLKVTDVEGCTDSLFLPYIVLVYFDTINQGKPFLFRTTHLPEYPLTEVLFSSVNERDFMHYTLFRADSLDCLKSLRTWSNKREDTLITDTFFVSFIPQCYYVKSLDFCENPSDPSRTHCLIHLNAGADESGNLLQWTPYIGWDAVGKYSIFRWRPEKAPNYVKLDEVGGSQLSYLDTNVNCAEIYFYKVVAHQQNALMQLSSSNTDSTIASKKMFIDPVKLIRVSVEDENILIEWEPAFHDYDFKYNLIRQTGASDKQLIYIADSNETSFTDKNVNTNEKSYIYKVQVFHPKCLYFSKTSNAGKSILLQLAKTEENENISLNWNEYYHWDAGVRHYEIEKKDPANAGFIKIGLVQNDSSFTDTEDDPLIISHTYKVKAISNEDENIVSNSNMVHDLNTPRINIPNAFTPNADGLNDFFEAKCYGCKLHKMQIYNRWGQLIFESEKEDAKWDGRFKGALCPLGVYYYNVFVNSEDGVSMHYGTVSLLR